MEVGVEVWIRDRQGDQSWIPAFVHSKEVLADGKLILVVKNEFGEDFKFSINDESQENDDLKLRNSPSESEVENLINLPYLHEPAILYCLQRRYDKSDIYTYTGPILIAMNPFKKVALYTNQILEVYYNSGLLKSQGIDSGTVLPPHVYAIADAAYREMMKVIMQGFGLNTSTKNNSFVSADHSILISGESGAGKTESTKIVLRYLTIVGNASGGLETEVGSVMDKVLQSNPILEAFGNARTLRNDNSSRFGKFIELNFNKRGHLIGGTIKTYLLEKVRLPTQQKGERNFHIFYQLVAGSNDEDRERWKLKTIDAFNYTNQGEIYTLRGISDIDEFKELKHALHILNFQQEDQNQLFDIVAGILHLGQVEFSTTHDQTGEGSEILNSEENFSSLKMASDLLGLGIDELIYTLTVRVIVAREETYEKKLTAIQASDARDAIAKAIYGRVFDWIVHTINLSIQVEKKQIRANIGVLDIFGFECFVHNSFEQLCINYTNETLQQQFNQYIFKMEQIEYQNEKIEWSFIEFPDNQDCLDLIEHKVNGILAMIDDECKLPKASDEKLAGRMHKQFESNPRFSATAPQKRDHKFCIRHYAGQVVYSTITFVEKNKDEVPKEATTLLQGSVVNLLSQLFTIFGPTGGTTKDDKLSYSTAGTATSRRPSQLDNKQQQAAQKTKSNTASISSLQSVASQFKEQLSNLMFSIKSTTPHYIRCLKPNDENVANNFNRLRITEQLRYGGVLEAVRVARSGFPVRLTHTDFYARYRPLANPFCDVTSKLPAFATNKNPTQMKEYCDMLLQALWDDSLPDENGISSNSGGATIKSTAMKLSRRNSKMEDLTLWKGKGNIAKESIQMGLTKVFLRKPAHDVLESRRSRRQVSAAKRIQCQYRGYLVKSQYNRMKWSIRFVQRMIRGMLARIRTNKIRKQRASLRIQTAFRSHLHYRRYKIYRFAMLSLQCCYRKKIAIRVVQKRRELVNAVKLQANIRRFVLLLKYKRFRRAVIVLQNRKRKIDAKNELKQLRIAAKDLGTLKQSNEALKAEIEKLKAMAAEENERIRLDMERKMKEKASQEKDDELGLLRSEMERIVKLLAEEKRLHEETKQTLSYTDNKLQETEAELAKTKIALLKKDEALSQSEYKLLQSEESVNESKSRIQALEHQSSLSSSSSSSMKNLRRSSSMMTPSKQQQQHGGNSDNNNIPGTLTRHQSIHTIHENDHERERVFSHDSTNSSDQVIKRISSPPLPPPIGSPTQQNQPQRNKSITKSRSNSQTNEHLASSAQHATSTTSLLFEQMQQGMVPEDLYRETVAELEKEIAEKVKLEIGRAHV